MNDHDRDNLNFLLRSKPEVIRDWFKTVNSDDIDYAWSLLEAYSREIEIGAAHLRADADMELLAINSAVPYAEANQVLAKFRLNSST